MATMHVLDTDWTGRPRSIAASLLLGNGQAALVDPGPASTLETLREKLRVHGLGVADLDAVLLTHIHLDHAGTAGSLVRENPRLAVYVHRNGAAHMADPAKLLTSAGRLYGDNLYRLFGDFLAVPAENLRILDGGEILALGGRKLEVVCTPGHASHHVSFMDATEGVAFVGDTTGMRIQVDGFVLPVTPPPDIDLEIWEGSPRTLVSPRTWLATSRSFESGCTAGRIWLPNSCGPAGRKRRLFRRSWPPYARKSKQRCPMTKPHTTSSTAGSSFPGWG